MRAGGGEKAFGRLIHFADVRKNVFQQRAVLRVEHFRHGNDFLWRNLKLACLDGQRQRAQHLRRRNDNRRRFGFKPCEQRVEGRKEIVKTEAQPAVVHALIEVIVSAQKERHPLAGEQAVRQHFREHGTCPQRLLLGADRENAAPPGCAARQPTL